MTPSMSPPCRAVVNFSTSSRRSKKKSMILESSSIPIGSQVSALKSPVWKISIAPLVTLVRVSILSVMPPMMPGAAVKAGLRIASPRRPRAAPALSMAPEKVSPALRAAPPIPASMAFWKVAKSISPEEARLVTSSAVFPISLARSWTMGMPWSLSWAMTSPWILLLVATLLKIDPIEDMSVPAMAAASPTSLRVRCRSWPGLTPAATVAAATVAASPSP